MRARRSSKSATATDPLVELREDIEQLSPVQQRVMLKVFKILDGVLDDQDGDGHAILKQLKKLPASLVKNGTDDSSKEIESTSKKSSKVKKKDTPSSSLAGAFDDEFRWGDELADGEDGSIARVVSFRK